ncbi:MAG: hypothetical protein U9P42_03500 [Candidatus Fermentibacteria bacterium]|nr:hypothetical protein [Candidatus Fermentibacteria bacterium]
MKGVLFLMTLLLTLPFAAQAFQTETYGWEETATVLGIYGNGIATIEDTTPVYNGTQSLKFEESPLGGTPQAYVGWIQDLNDGDTVAASFWVYDDTSSGNPSGRIWGHWNDDPSDPDVYNGSAGGNADYSAGTGWSLLEWEWTVEDGHTGLIIEGRIYAAVEYDTVWFDDLTIIAPDAATILFPDYVVSLERQSWGGIKTSF